MEDHPSSRTVGGSGTAFAPASGLGVLPPGAAPPTAPSAALLQSGLAMGAAHPGGQTSELLAPLALPPPVRAGTAAGGSLGSAPLGMGALPQLPDPAALGLAAGAPPRGPGPTSLTAGFAGVKRELDAALQGPLGAQYGAPGSGTGPVKAESAGGGGQSGSLEPEAMATSLVARIAAAGASVIFEKALTASDVSGNGRVVVPKSVAERYFPTLDQPSGVTISATDLDGRTYTFKWRFWVNNSSRMYLLEGAGELHRNYGLEVGDVMVFAQKPDGSLVVAGRAGNKSDVAKKPPAKRNTAAGSTAGRSKEPRPPRPPARPSATPSLADYVPPVPASRMVLEAPAEGGMAPARKRKSATPGCGGPDPRVRARTEEAISLSVLDMEAPSDGVFRAVATQYECTVPLGVALARSNRWTATLDLGGELYQAFFDTKEDALEALAAAGAVV